MASPGKKRRKKKPSVLPIPDLPNAINPVHQLRVMGRLVRRSISRPGASPGTLIHTGPQHMEEVRIRFLDYDETEVREREEATIAQVLPLRERPTVSWINVDGLHDVEVVRTLGEHFDVHPLILEDVLATGQRPKMEEYDEHLFIVLHMLTWNDERREVVIEQVSFLAGESYVISFQERVGDVFESIRERIREGRPRMRKGGPDYLLYALVDSVVDHYFTVLERLGDRAEVLDLEVTEDPGAGTMRRLHDLKREMLVVRKSVWPLRDALGSLMRTENPLVQESTRVFLRDVHDHAVQIIDTVETLRDAVAGTVDLYLSNISHRTNEVMKVLTIMASIFIPLTFLAGIYGMNFEYMPELGVRWAYPALLGLMAFVGLGMAAYFKRKGWW